MADETSESREETGNKSRKIPWVPFSLIFFIPFLGRSRRTKQDKHGRLAALQKLKDLKGTKNKVALTEVDNIYEEVDEKEYSRRVQQRQEDDWIIDDGFPIFPQFVNFIH